MEGINPQEIALIGITYVPKWYKGPLKSIKHTDKVRGDLILESLNYAARIGYRVVIADGSSSKTFQHELKKITGLKVFYGHSHRRSPKRRKALFEASKISDVKVIVMSEIEKTSYIKDCILPSIKPILEGYADVVVPKREVSLFKKSYPDYMFESEMEGNLLYNEGLKADGLLPSGSEDLDVFFGVRAFKNDRKMLKELFSKYKANRFDSIIVHKLFDFEEYSNAQFFPVVKALAAGYKVASVTVPFLYPEMQKKNEEKGERKYFILKRRYQKLTVLIELMHFLGYLEHRKTRKIKKIR